MQANEIITEVLRYSPKKITVDEYIKIIESIKNMPILDLFRPDPAWLIFYLGETHPSVRLLKNGKRWTSNTPDIRLLTSYRWKLYLDNKFLFSGDNLPNENYDSLRTRLNKLFEKYKLTKLDHLKISPHLKTAKLFFNDDLMITVNYEKERGLLVGEFYNSMHVYIENNQPKKTLVKEKEVTL